jgi:hypothetical protein
VCLPINSATITITINQSIKIRLLMYGADLACGLDMFLEPDPAKYLRKGQPEAAEVRKELTFYDLWVARDIQGQRFQWAPPFALHVAPAKAAVDVAAAADAGADAEALTSAQRRHSKRRERCVDKFGLGWIGWLEGGLFILITLPNRTTQRLGNGGRARARARQ